MKTEQIILQLQRWLPTLSPFFSKRVTISSVSKSGLTATVNTATAHKLNAGDLVTVSGIYTPNEIDSFVETASLVTFHFTTPHDLTFNPTALLDAGQTVFIQGSSPSIVGAVYELKSVPNRNSIIVKRGTNAPLPIDTVLYMQSSVDYGYNGLKVVSAVPSATSLQYAIDFDLPEPNYTDNTPFLCTSPRISGAIDLETLLESYTEQASDAIWAFVVLADNQANKDRLNQNDATTTQGRQADFRQKIITGFSVYIFVPNKGDILTKTNGRAARDVIEDIRLPLFKSLLGVDLSADLYAPGQGIITYNGDGFSSYNSAFYVHEFRFQQVIEITSRDTAIRDFERAFRDISVIHKNQFSELTTYLSQINLDEEPE